MGIGSTVFNAQWTALSSARAALRVGKKQIDRCLCGSFATVRQDSEEGTFESIVASVKVLKSDWPEGTKIEGARVDFSRYGTSLWTRGRVSGVSETDGVYSLSIESEFE
jgi:hypothetical protein